MRTFFCILLVLAAKGMIYKSIKSSIRQDTNRTAIERALDRNRIKPRVPRTRVHTRHDTWVRSRAAQRGVNR